MLSTYITRNVIFVFLFLTGFSTILSSVYAQSPREKKLQVQLKDTLTKESDGSIRVKPGFTIEANGESGFTVRSLQKEIVGSFFCGVCGGGRCHTKILPPDRGFCVGCNGGACLIDPF